MISHAVRAEGSAVIAEHCGKEWRLQLTESDAKLVVEITTAINSLQSLVEQEDG